MYLVFGMLEVIALLLKGLKALWSPHTGIVDWGLVSQYYGKDFSAMGGQIHLNFEVNGFTVAPESQRGSGDGNKYKIRVTGANGVSEIC